MNQQTYAFRDPAAKEHELWCVLWEGEICSPRWDSKGGALAYLDMLRRGDRKPEV